MHLQKAWKGMLYFLIDGIIDRFFNLQNSPKHLFICVSLMSNSILLLRLLSFFKEFVRFGICSYKIYTRYSLIPECLLGIHAAYLFLPYSNFPSVNGLIGTCSLSRLSLLNMSADC